jgi:hypothetical protein
MRSFLFFIGWASLVGSVLDGAMASFALWIVADGGWAEPTLSVDTLLRTHLYHKPRPPVVRFQGETDEPAPC